jgi:hypothetical protein
MAQKRILVSSSKKLFIFKRDKYTCQYCGVSGSEIDLECDHVHPVSKGGTNDINNLITACKPCNRNKSDSVDWVPNNINNDFLYFWDTRLEDYTEREVNGLSNKDILLNFYKINKSDILNKEIIAYKLNIHDGVNPYEIVKLSLTDTQILNIKYYNSYKEMSNDYAEKASACNKTWTIKNRPNWNFMKTESFQLPMINNY